MVKCDLKTLLFFYEMRNLIIITKIVELIILSS